MRWTSNGIAVVLCGLVCLGAGAAEPVEADGPAVASTAAPTESQQRARALFNEMARYLGAQDQFSVTVNAGYDAVQEDGEKIQFLENRQLAIDRPNRLRMTERRDDGSSNDTLFDGTKITIWDGHQKVFAQADQPETIDDSLIYFVRDLRMRLPLAPLFMNRLSMQLDSHITTIDYVEATRATGVPTNQVAARMDTGVDLQMWIADGDRPLPQRVVLTYRNAPGKPQFFAQFSNWNLQPRFDAKTFTFDAPPDARQIAFAVQIPLIAEPARPTDAQLPGAQP